MQNEQNIRVIKKESTKPQLLASEGKTCAILSGDEFVRRQWRALVRIVKEMERQYGFRFDSDN